MSKFIDLTGQRFGRLLVIEKTENNKKNNRIQWKCICDCGEIKNIDGHNLKSGKTISCGCYNRGKSKKVEDLIGKNFGRLLVIERIARPENVKFGTYWLCQCNCGNKTTASSRDLKAGDSQSCGCYKKESAGKRSLIDLKGQRFGKLLVIERVPNIKSVVCYRCLCDCGNEKIISRNSLRSGNSKSCGCLRSEYAKKGLSFGEASFNKKYREYIRHANERKLYFELSIEKFKELTSKNCFYCDEKPKQISKSRWKTGNFIYNGIDRINNEIGYIESNVVPCCGDCNRAKRAMSQQDFFSWIERVYNHSIKDKK